MRVANISNLAASVLDIHARASKDNIEVHAVDTDAGVIPGEEECEKDPIDKFDYVSWPLNITTIFSGNGLVLLGFYNRNLLHHCKKRFFVSSKLRDRGSEHLTSWLCSVTCSRAETSGT